MMGEDRLGQDGRAGQEQPDSQEGRAGQEGLSRRELLKRAGLVVGAAVVAPVAAQPQTSPGQPPLETLRSLTRFEYETLDAICSRIIPTDANGPGAREARAARYIDWGLSGALRSARDQYASGLAAVEAYASASRGALLSRLSPADQDAIVDDLARNVVPGAPPAFFNTVRAHTIQGTFADPFYGGNANYVGWDLIGYPGVRVAVPAEYQQWGTDLKPNHQSAYDSDMFSKGVI